MPTAQSIIEQAMKKIHVLGRGEALDNDAAQDALTSLNNMLASWSVEGGLVFTETRETFSCTGATSYTIGSGGDFNTVKPYSINSVYVTQGTSDTSLSPYDQKEYANITEKTTGGLASIYYFDNNYPLSNIFFYPLPDSSYTVTIYSDKVLESFTSLTDDIDLPQGYERALVFNLAIELAPDYEKEATQSVHRIAGKSKKIVFTSNARNDNNVLKVDDALIINITDYNIREGY